MNEMVAIGKIGSDRNIIGYRVYCKGAYKDLSNISIIELIKQGRKCINLGVKDNRLIETWNLSKMSFINDNTESYNIIDIINLGCRKIVRIISSKGREKVVKYDSLLNKINNNEINVANCKIVKNHISAIKGEIKRTDLRKFNKPEKVDKIAYVINQEPVLVSVHDGSLAVKIRNREENLIEFENTGLDEEIVYVSHLEKLNDYIYKIFSTNFYTGEGGRLCQGDTVEWEEPYLMVLGNYIQMASSMEEIIRKLCTIK